MTISAKRSSDGGRIHRISFSGLVILGLGSFRKESGAKHSKTNLSKSTTFQSQPHAVIGLKRFGTGGERAGEGSPEQIEENPIQQYVKPE